MPETNLKATILTLPAELRLAILSHVLVQPPNIGFVCSNVPSSPHLRGLELESGYSSSAHLKLLLTCRQFHQDFTGLAFRRTTFHILDMSTPFATLLQPLLELHIQNLQRIVLVACARHFREMVHWVKWPFNMEGLHLEELTIAMHKSNHWHYPADFTTDLVGLLRRLQHVDMLRFMLNGANFRGSFKTWYNRLVGLILKEDHFQRYDAPGAPNTEEAWWTWKYDEDARWFELTAGEPKRLMDEAEYMEMVKPWVERLVMDMQNEEEDNNPRRRTG